MRWACVCTGIGFFGQALGINYGFDIDFLRSRE